MSCPFEDIGDILWADWRLKQKISVLACEATRRHFEERGKRGTSREGNEPRHVRPLV
jgi:hypothetical protein